MVDTSVQNSNPASKTSGRSKFVSSKRKSASAKNGATRKTRGKNQQGLTSKLYSQGRNAVEGAYNTASDIGSSLPKISRNLHLRDRSQTVYDMIENKPLIFGAVGLGVGMVIAALLPTNLTRSSNRR